LLLRLDAVGLPNLEFLLQLECLLQMVLDFRQRSLREGFEDGKRRHFCGDGDQSSGPESAKGRTEVRQPGHADSPSSDVGIGI
jgi:hypothetical protein